MEALRYIEARTGNSTLYDIEHKKHIHNFGASGTTTHTLTLAKVGLEMTFASVVANKSLVITAAGSDVIVDSGTQVTSAGGTMTNAAGSTAGNILKLVCLTPGYWHVIAKSGTWTAA